MKRSDCLGSDMPSENLALLNFITTTKRGNKKAFAESIGVSSQSINKLLLPKTGSVPEEYLPVSRKMQFLIAEKYDLPQDWLDKEAEKIDKEREENGYITPQVRKAAGAPSYIEYKPFIKNTTGIAYNLPIDVNKSNPKKFSLMPVIGYFPKYDMTTQINMDSMEPTFKKGDIVALRDVTNSPYHQWGHCYLINTAEQGITIARVFPDEAKKAYRILFDNKQYTEFSIPKNTVLNLYLVVGFLRSEFQM